MFIVSLTYQKSLSKIAEHIPAHRVFLDKYYEEGFFLASGAKNPREGGVIIVSGKVSRPQLERILTEDPFHSYALAQYDITEFIPSKYIPALHDSL